MGDMAWYYTKDQLPEDMFDEEKNDELMETVFGGGHFRHTTRDGKQMELSEMSTNHLNNTIKYLKRSIRNKVKLEGLLSYYEHELKKRV